MEELDPAHAIRTSRTAIGYADSFDQYNVDWGSEAPWPHRIELAKALDWITELGAMVQRQTTSGFDVYR